MVASSAHARSDGPWLEMVLLLQANARTLTNVSATMNAMPTLHVPILKVVTSVTVFQATEVMAAHVRTSMSAKKKNMIVISTPLVPTLTELTLALVMMDGKEMVSDVLISSNAEMLTLVPQTLFALSCQVATTVLVLLVTKVMML